MKYACIKEWADTARSAYLQINKTEKEIAKYHQFLIEEARKYGLQEDGKKATSITVNCKSFGTEIIISNVNTLYYYINVLGIEDGWYDTRLPQDSSKKLNI